MVPQRNAQDVEQRSCALSRNAKNGFTFFFRSFFRLQVLCPARGLSNLGLCQAMHIHRAARTRAHARAHSLRTQPAVIDRERPTCVSDHIVTHRLLPIPAVLVSKWQLKQRGCERALGRNSQNAGPPMGIGLGSRGSKPLWLRAGLCASKPSHKVKGVIAPASLYPKS